MSRIPTLARAQRGASLLIVLTLTAAIGLATLTGFYLSRNQFRLVGNIQHLEQAFNQAEAVVADAEDWLTTGNNSRAAGFGSRDTTQPALYPAGSLASNALDPRTMAWDDTQSTVSGDGRYLIERVAQGRSMPGNSVQVGQRNARCRAVDLFRVTGRSNSVRGASRTVESAFATEGC
jgi:Tfp pilus assembly protein PilX